MGYCNMLRLFFRHAMEINGIFCNAGYSTSAKNFVILRHIQGLTAHCFHRNQTPKIDDNALLSLVKE